MSEKGSCFRVPPIRLFSRSPPLRRMAHEHIMCAFILCVFFSALKDFWNASNAFVSVFCTTCDAGSLNKFANDLASMEWCDELLSVFAHGPSQFVPGSYNGLGFLWLTPATLTGWIRSYFPSAHYWGCRGRGFESRRSDHLTKQNQSRKTVCYGRVVGVATYCHSLLLNPRNQRFYKLN